ncbi:hypothetical protein [Nocardia flavorosea]|uniref:Uncharacterized protein n=1 Tax=Nocardia flavorosea TaxID=53429 RepID=A0A846YMY6_9NOCA|nr:hypothetical protein [Nocardia flavorosea]NKY58279.1 hypothetical protein [Nocardia flavorosea]
MGVLADVDTVVVGAGVVDTSGDMDVVVELAGVGLVVVLVGTVGAVIVVSVGAVVVAGAVVVVVGTVVAGGSDVAVTVGGSAGSALGSAVTVTVDVSVGGAVTGTVENGGEVTVSGPCMLGGAWIEMLAVAEKLTVIDASVEFTGGGSVVMAVVDSGAVAVPVPGSLESAVGWTVSTVVTVSVPATSPGTETPPGGPGGVLVIVMLVRLRTVL